MQLRYECHWARDCAVTVTYTRTILASGKTPEEVEADATRQCREMDGWDLRAVGVHNTRADWEAMFGPSTCHDAAFFAPAEPERPTVFRRLMTRLRCR